MVELCSRHVAPTQALRFRRVAFSMRWETAVSRRTGSLLLRLLANQSQSFVCSAFSIRGFVVRRAGSDAKECGHWLPRFMGWYSYVLLLQLLIVEPAVWAGPPGGGSRGARIVRLSATREAGPWLSDCSSACSPSRECRDHHLGPYACMTRPSGATRLSVRVCQAGQRGAA